MTEPITSFKGRNEFLSNFFPVRVKLDDDLVPVWYDSVEHAYQAAKTTDPERRFWVGTAATPAEAKKRGRRVPLRGEWENMKLEIMLDLLRQKFSDQHLALALALTGDAELVEDNWWGDRFWGTVRGQGENWLGQLLMHVRREVLEHRRIPAMFFNMREQP